MGLAPAPDIEISRFEASVTELETLNLEGVEVRLGGVEGVMEGAGPRCTSFNSILNKTKGDRISFAFLFHHLQKWGGGGGSTVYRPSLCQFNAAG